MITYKVIKFKLKQNLCLKNKMYNTFILYSKTMLKLLFNKLRLKYL